MMLNDDTSRGGGAAADAAAAGGAEGGGGGGGGTPKASWSLQEAQRLFASRLASYFHVVLSMSPLHKDFRKRIRLFRASASWHSPRQPRIPTTLDSGT